MFKGMIIEYPDSIPAAINLSQKDFEDEARRAMAVKLYEMGRLSSGQAATIAGIGRVEFLLTCMQMGVSSVEWDEEEIQSEFSTGEQI